MRTVVAGVLGHIDHGKTALVRALTGTDTDRLREEKARGISIALGFARLALPDGEIDLVDMPGHERFVRTMVSGATALEAALLVVDAGEGVRPQTVEHLAIASLIGVRRAVVAVARCDLAPPERAAAAAEAAQELCARLGFAAAPAVTVSAVTGQGLAELTERLAALLRDPAERPDHGFAWLPVDRVFAVAGFGTVVTGTLRRGRLAVGDAVELLPGGRPARVRSLQIHGRAVAATGPGRRTAVALRGVERADVTPGMALATPGALAPADWLDVAVRVPPGAARPLETGAAVRLLFGTTEAEARVRLLDREKLKPGAEAVAQLRCTTPVWLPAGEPFVLRAGSPPATLAGGRILAAAAGRRRRNDPDTLALLRALSAAAPAEAAALHLRAAGAAGMRPDALARAVGLAPGALAVAEAEALPDGTLLHREALPALAERLLALVAEHQRQAPTDPGLPLERLRALPGVPSAVAEAVAARLAAAGRLVREGTALRLPRPEAERLLSDTDRALLAALETTFRRAGLTPPDPAAAADGSRRRAQALRHLVRRGTLVRTVDRVQKREILFHREALARARRILTHHLADRRTGFPVGEAGRLLGISRKYCVPLLEHLDATGFTRRDGDRRILAEPGTPKEPAAGDGGVC
ncbi:selenocysteine-specific translation elongation factor [Azospirillum sp. ST 5-10]|uniref:selenocysteine-specific translation elongation factor n=1 Tax=unclassified Azospirillum TaxID=2630922 RepID=UPI003F49BDEE